MSQSNEYIDHNRQKKIAVINDVTGFGRCSVAVQLPIISKLHIQCCAVPTAVLSNQTGFKSFFIDDYTKHFKEYTAEWKKIGLRFSAITSGFLGSAQQIDMISDFIKEFDEGAPIIIIDPVMGDHGHLYANYTPEMSRAMKRLIGHAEIITPNLTEACFLCDVPYHEGKWSKKEIALLMSKLTRLGPGKIVITGISQGEFVANAVYDPTSTDEILYTRQAKVGTERNGTGDVFSAIIAADAVNHVPFIQSVKRASRFVKLCIEKSIEMGIPNTDGVAFEEVIDKLKPYNK
ncbi:MAG: pyridoxamine kinase [Eubacterium sp.]|nr:pyridoxamine kinase [Eubacterium sp.]